MASVDTYNNIAPVMNIPPAAYVADVVPIGADLQSYEGATAIVFAGVITDGTWAIILEENDVAAFGDAGWAPVDPDQIIGALPGPLLAANSGDIYKIGYIGMMRYIRIRIDQTVAGTGVFGCIIERGAPRFAPTPEDLNA